LELVSIEIEMTIEKNGINPPSVDRDRVFVLDGGFGSLLESLGYDVNKHDLWSGGANMDRPDLVSKAHKKFIDAGADIIMTNTYHCCIKKLQETRGFTVEQGEEVINKAVKLAKEAMADANREVFLVGSIGPYATYFRDASEYSGAYVKKPGFQEQTIIDYYLQQATPLLKSGVKSLVFETIPSLKEVECVGKVLEQLDSDVRAWIVVTCKDGKTTRSGDLFSEVVRMANGFEKVTAVGANCTSPLHITELLQNAQIESTKNKPIVVYPNSGEVYSPENKKFEGDTKINLIAEMIPSWYRLGARIFGGCCRVLPEHMNKIAHACGKLGPEHNESN